MMNGNQCSGATPTNPWIAGHASTVKEIVDSLAEGLGGFLEEPLSVDVVYLGPGKGGLAGCPGLDIVGGSHSDSC